jgi:hypothetical protein
VATFVFNIAKGRVAEFYNRVENNDPSTSILSVHALSATPSQATAQDVDDYAALITAGATELNANGWNVKTLTDVELAAFPAPDDTNDRYAVPIPTFNWTPTAGNSVALVICYSSLASPTNAQRIPLTHHDFAVTADGNQVVVNAGDFFRAT